jgi:hypothetical protein
MKEGKRKLNDLRFRVKQQEPEDPEEEDYEDVSDLDNEEIARLNYQLEVGSQAT